MAIIGFGSIGKRYLRLIKKNYPNLRITIVRSQIKKKTKFHNKLVKEVASIKEVISMGVQAAIISSPSTLHVSQAQKLIKGNIHVLIEKPVSNNIKSAEKLLKISKKKNIVGLVGYCLRHTKLLQKFKQMIEKKILGKILNVRVECFSYMPHWRKNANYLNSVSARKNLGGGALLELSHEIDYIRWFFGEINLLWLYGDK